MDTTHPGYTHIHHRKPPPPLVIQHQSYIPQPNNLPPLSAEVAIASPSYSHSSAATSNNRHSSFCSDPSHKRYDSFASSSTNNSSLLYVNQGYSNNSQYSFDDEPSYDASSSNATARDNIIPNSISTASLDSTLNPHRVSLATDNGFVGRSGHIKSPSLESISHPSQKHQQYKSNKASRWFGGVFSGNQHGNTGGHSQAGSTILGSSTAQPIPELLNPKDAKKAAKEAEKKRREDMLNAQRERARAVLNKQKSLGKEVIQDSIKNAHPHMQPNQHSLSQSRRPSHATSNIHNYNINMHLPRSPQHLDPLSSPLSPPLPLPTSRSRSGSRSHSETGFLISDELTMARSKARRRNEDDDHSMSSYSSLHLDPDQRSSLSLSRLSFATDYSDPGPNPSQSAIHRKASQNSFRTTKSSPHLSHIHQQQSSQSSQANDLAERIDKTNLNISKSQSIPDQNINPIFKLPPFSHISEQADKGREGNGNP